MSINRDESVSVGSLAVVGLIMMLVSAAFPWVRAQASSTTIELSPMGTEAFRPSAALVLFVAVVGGVVYAVTRRTTALIGVAGTLWGTFAVILWYLGLRLQWLLPETILSDESAVQLTPAIVLAIVGAAFAVLGTVSDTVFATYRITRVPTVPVTRLTIGCVAVALLLWARGFRWVIVDSSKFSFAVGADSIPFIGDLIGLAILAVVVMALVSLVSPRRLIGILIVILATVLAMVSVVGYAAGRVLRGGVESALRDYRLFTDVPVSIEVGAGAVLTAAASMCAVVFGSVVIVQGARRRTPVEPGPDDGGGGPTGTQLVVDF